MTKGDFDGSGGSCGTTCKHAWRTRARGHVHMQMQMQMRTHNGTRIELQTRASECKIVITEIDLSNTHTAMTTGLKVRSTAKALWCCNFL